MQAKLEAEQAAMEQELSSTGGGNGDGPSGGGDSGSGGGGNTGVKIKRPSKTGSASTRGPPCKLHKYKPTVYQSGTVLRAAHLDTAAWWVWQVW